MFTAGLFRTVTSVLLATVLLVSTAPLSAADFTNPSALGVVSGSGPVALRGVSVNQEGTLFSGDRLHTGDRAYAKVLLLNGNKLELSSNTDFVVSRNGQDVTVGLTAGNVAFTASKTPVAITIGNYQVLPKANSSGNVAFVGAE